MEHAESLSLSLSFFAPQSHSLHHYHSHGSALAGELEFCLLPNLELYVYFLGFCAVAARCSAGFSELLIIYNGI